MLNSQPSADRPPDRPCRFRGLSSRTIGYLVTIVAAATGLYMFLAPRLSVLEITATDSDQVCWCAHMALGEEFMISFTHSVNKRPVYDTLQAQGDHIVIVKSRFDSFGAGMPESTTDQGSFKMLPDGWLEWTVNRPMPEIVVRVGRVAEHILNIKAQDIPLAALAEPGRALQFRVRKISLLDTLKGRCIRE